MAIVTVQDIYRCDSCKAASDELGRGCKHGMLFPLMLIMGNFTECMNYEFDAEKVKLQLKRKDAKQENTLPLSLVKLASASFQL